jgi:hypothetical protein
VRVRGELNILIQNNNWFLIKITIIKEVKLNILFVYIHFFIKIITIQLVN